MKRISSILTIPYKVFLLLISSVVFFIGISAFFDKNLLAATLLLSISIVVFILAKRLKSVFVNEEIVFCKGFFSRRQLKKSDLKRVGNTFLYFYLEFNNKKRVYFLNTVKDEIKAHFHSSESAEKDIFNKIKP